MTKKIQCPECGCEIDIENLIQAGAKEALNKELRAQKSEYEKEIKKLQKENQSAKDNLDKALEEQKSKFDKQYEKLKEETAKLEEKSKQEKEKAVEDALKFQKQEFKSEREKIKNAVLEEQKEAMETLEKELNAKSEQLKEMNKLKAEKIKIEREKSELEEKIRLQAEVELQQKLAEEKQKMQKNAEEKFELKIKELEKQLQDQKELTAQMKKRQEQGSMQLQGEVQELAIEEYLKQNFKYDEIQEVGKGDMGADSLQTINTMQKQNCGTIYYESKRTKTFKEEWIGKFKNDIQTKGADIGVLVTAIYPKGMSRMGLRDGIYICTYEEFKALSFILRESIIKLSEAKELQENRHEKSALLYQFLTSTEFAFQIETILSSFITMQNDLEAEKRAMNKLWKKREKEIQNVISATTDMYGAIQGIAGNAVKPVAHLEMPLLEAFEE